MKINNVVIVGGTHGNEITGVYLIKKWKKDPSILKRPSANMSLFLANNEAIQKNRRYVDRDLNRCFLEKDLNNADLHSLEDQQAKKINALLGPKGNAKNDMIIDMHTTTANMGITVISNTNPFNLKAAAYVQSVIPGVKIYCIEKSDRIDACLRSVTPFSLGIEVGPVPQGVLRQDVFEKTVSTVTAILDYIELHNNGVAPEAGTEIEIFRHLAVCHFPMDEKGALAGMVHKGLEGRDYRELKPGEPVFCTFHGKVIPFESEKSVYPVFINEAAYYDKNVAFSTTEKIVISGNADGSIISTPAIREASDCRPDQTAAAPFPG